MISIGQTFAEERKRQNITIEEISKATKIRPEFLEAIEKGEYKLLPSAAYAHGFVRNYAKFLGLNVERSLAIFRREFDEKKQFEVLPRGLANPDAYSPSKLKIGRSVILITGIFVILIAFLLYQYRSAVLNPTLKIDSPKENATLSSTTLEVKGKTDPNATLEIENEAVSINPDGSFKKEVTVFPGDSTLNFKVTNRFGRETQVIRRVVVKPGY